MNQHVLNFKQLFIKALLGKAKVPGGVAFGESVDPEWFNYSLDSLYYVDSYLFSVFVSHDELEEKQVENTLWAIGFYLGEVVIRNSNKGYKWKNWDEFFPCQEEDVQETYFQTMGTSAVLVGEDNSFILPLEQVIKFIKEGPQNSLHFFASQEAETANV